MTAAGRVAVVTGAGGGIGGALARKLARNGFRLALVDVDGDAMARTAAAVREAGAEVSVHMADLSDAETVDAVAEAVLRAHEQVDVLVNNAGVALFGGFHEMRLSDFEWLLSVNFWAAVHLTKRLLPHLLSRPSAQIVNVSSVFGLIAPEGQTAYAASKFALRGFSEALRHELQGTSVSVMVVYPGGVRTGIAGSARRSPGISEAAASRMVADFERTARTAPDRAAAIISAGIERRARRLLVGADAVLVDLIQRLAPVRYPSALRMLILLLTGRRPTRVTTINEQRGE